MTGYVSWRDTQLGSWYVETLDHILEENAANDDLVTMLMMVSFFYYTSKGGWSHCEYHWPLKAFKTGIYLSNSYPILLFPRLMTKYPKILQKASTSRCLAPLTSSVNSSSFKHRRSTKFNSLGTFVYFSTKKDV